MRVGSLSVRARLAFWHAGVLAVIVCAFAIGTFFVVRAWLYRDLDLLLGRDLATIERVYREEPSDLHELVSRVGITMFEVLENGKPVYRTAEWGGEGLSAAPRGGQAPEPWSWLSPKGRHYRLGEIADASHRITLALDENPVLQTLRTLAVIFSLGVPLAAGLAIAGGLFLAERVLSPIGTMAEKARKISADSLGERLPVENPDDEFGRLANVLNDALSRVNDSFEQLRRFTADASHELRTPLTAMRSVGEVALRKSLDLDGYRDVIGSQLEEVNRLTHLVDGLLTLTRAGSGTVPLQPEPVDLGAMASSVAELHRVLAEEKEQTLSVAAATQVKADCDPAIFRQGLSNVLHNAIKYTPAKGTIRVEVRKLSSAEAAIEIVDNGPGIPAMHHARIFERFYRVDEGRSRDAGGVGLGLAIARWAVEANGGRIEVESVVGEGCLFRIVLPLAA